MWSTAREIAAGDLVIIWLTRDLLQPLVVVPGKEFNSKFGHYRHNDFLGLPYGSKLGSRSGKGFVHVLRPTPELWTMALPHRTQILYLADIAFVTSHLDIKRGSLVIEAGTGSGSFSHSVARTVGADGHLWSYEFHEYRAAKAREEFERHGMNDIITLTHRNVCKDGFSVTDTVDSVFLDLPAPWEAVEHSKKALRKDRTTRICCFSPCIEQVLRTVNALNDAGFTEITMYETLLRPIDVVQVPVLTPITTISAKLKHAEVKREEKRLKQIAAGKLHQQQLSASKRKREDASTAFEDDQPETLTMIPEESTFIATAREPGVEAGSKSQKRLKTHDDVTVTRSPQGVTELDTTADDEDFDDASGRDNGGRDDLFPAAATATAPYARISPPAQISMEKISVSKVMSEVRGHTSYLTFAQLQPFSPIIDTDQSEDAVKAPPHAAT